VKIVLSLMVSVAAVALLFLTYQLQTGRRVLPNDLSRSAKIVGERLQETIEPLFDSVADQFLRRGRGFASYIRVTFD
jgi:hypothetical protein